MTRCWVVALEFAAPCDRGQTRIIQGVRCRSLAKSKSALVSAGSRTTAWVVSALVGERGQEQVSVLLTECLDFPGEYYAAVPRKTVGLWRAQPVESRSRIRRALWQCVPGRGVLLRSRRQVA